RHVKDDRFLARCQDRYGWCTDGTIILPVASRSRHKGMRASSKWPEVVAVEGGTRRGRPRRPRWTHEAVMVAAGADQRPGRRSVLTRASAEPSPGRHVRVRAFLRGPSRQSPSGGSPRTHSAVSALGAAPSESGSQAVPRRILPCEPCSTLLFHPHPNITLEL